MKLGWLQSLSFAQAPDSHGLIVITRSENSSCEYRPADPRLTGGAVNGSGNGRARMSREEALDLLGLPPSASVQEISEAHRRLGHLLDPQLGGTRYLSMKVNEARDVLLGG
jgi:hypothetical protein